VKNDDSNSDNESSKVDVRSTDWLLEFSQSRLNIDPADLRPVLEQANVDNVSIHEAGLKKGVLDIVQADVLETISNPDSTLPDYEIQDVLGRGAMGVVYRARQKSLDRTVAIKTILLSLAGQGSNQRFQQEAKTIAQLRHPNILSAYDLHTHNGRLYLILEYLEGETVEELLKNCRQMDEFAAWHLIRQAAAGLSEANNLGIVHRDIKPANLFCVTPPAGFPLPEGVPLLKITDFGLALLTESDEDETRMTQQGSTLGTPAFMAPEQVGESDVDLRADIYALGVTIFALISSQMPFKGKMMLLISKKIAQEAPSLQEFKPDASQASTDLIAHMLRRNPDERISDYGELLRRIDKVIAELSSGSSATAQIASGVGQGTECAAKSGQSTNELATAQFASVESSEASTIVPQDRPSETDSKPRDSPRRRKNVVIAIGVGLLGIAAFVLVEYFNGSPKNPSTMRQTEMVLTGKSEYLFDGKSASGWTTSGGSMNPMTDSEGGRFLGIRSTAQRTMPPYKFYTLAFGLDLRSASSFELHFGFLKNDGHLVYRISESRISVAKLLSNGETELLREVSLKRSPWRREFDDEPIYREIKIDREPHRWSITFDGKHVADVGSSNSDPQPTVGFVARDGQVGVEGITVVEQAPKVTQKITQ
jgi:eukaryotic-like serine/threonine-protein kinase